jgi:CheY-like chemotaxis protein
MNKTKNTKAKTFQTAPERARGAGDGGIIGGGASGGGDGLTGGAFNGSGGGDWSSISDGNYRSLSKLQRLKTRPILPEMAPTTALTFFGEVSFLNMHIGPKMSEKKFQPPLVEKIHDLDSVAEPASRKKILLVDDDAALAELTRIILEEYGYEVDVAFDGVQGIKKVMASDYSVILCDMVMPNLAGDMFYMAVERVKPHLCKRFLFTTGHQGDRKVDDFIRKVRGLILWKPFQPHVLIESIQAVEKKCGQG